MTKRIILRNEKIEYQLKKHKTAKRLKVAIYCGGDVIVTAPWRMNFKNVERFMRENAEWMIEKLKKMKKEKEDSIFVKNNPKEYKRLKEAARTFVSERIEKWNQFYGFPYNRIFIKNQRTRWGSCSSNRNLSFNYKILLLPKKHADYIIVHELCHLKEFNHSKRFWNLVAETFPDYEKIVTQMRAL
jgi:predicted metal-dependent hydrolase